MSSWWEKYEGDMDGDGVVTPHQTALLMIKPDNLERPSSLPGHIIDMISTTVRCLHYPHIVPGASTGSSGDGRMVSLVYCPG